MTTPYGPQPSIDELVRRIGRLSTLQRDEVECGIRRLERQCVDSAQHGPPPNNIRPHAPRHCLQEAGTYIITAGTCNQQYCFRAADAIDLLPSELLTNADKHGRQREARVCDSNHYHFVGHSPADAGSLRTFLNELHSATARKLKLRDRVDGRQVWFNV